MTKIKLFCFLIAIELISSLQSNQNYDPKKTDFQNCREEGENQCSSFKMKSKAFQCCFSNLTESTDGRPYQDQSCDVMLNPTKLANDEINTENGKFIVKEWYGYDHFGDHDRSRNHSSKVNYYCPDGDYSYTFDARDISENEIEKFKSPNHCMKHLYQAIRKTKVTKETCFNAIFATTGNSDISCGFYEMKLYLTNGTTKDFNACYFFNDDTLKDKNVGRLFKVNSEEFSWFAVDEAKEISYYKITMTSPKGRYYVYNSLDDTVVLDTDSGKFLGYKYLLILILFLI